MSVREVRASTWVTGGVFVAAAVLYAVAQPGNGDPSPRDPSPATPATTSTTTTSTAITAGGG